MRYEEPHRSEDIEYVRTEPRDRALRSPVFEMDQRMLVDEARGVKSGHGKEWNVDQHGSKVPESSNHNTKRKVCMATVSTAEYIELQCS